MILLLFVSILFDWLQKPLHLLLYSQEILFVLNCFPRFYSQRYFVVDQSLIFYPELYLRRLVLKDFLVR